MKYVQKEEVVDDEFCFMLQNYTGIHPDPRADWHRLQMDA